MTSPTPAKARAAFLDRDGVINQDLNYVHKIEDFHFLPRVLQACRKFVEQGYQLVLITNQAGIARGFYGLEELRVLHDWLRARFMEAGAPLAGIYYCPHHPQGEVPEFRRECACRKPAPGMILEACRDLNVDPAASFLVGDKPWDIEAGRRAGVGRCFLYASSQPPGSERVPDPFPPDAIVTSLAEVARLLQPSA